MFVTIMEALHMAHRAISVTDAPVASGNYSQAIVAAGLLFVAGNGPYDPVGDAASSGRIPDR